MGVRFTGMGGTGKGCGCCGPPPGCAVKVCAPGCLGTGIAGVTVQVKNGSAVVDSQVTDSSGCATLTISEGGSYTIVYYSGLPTGWAETTLTETLACGESYSFMPDVASGYICAGCCNDPVPQTVHLTDAVATIPAQWYGATSQWITYLTAWQSSNSVSPVCGGDCSQPTTSGPTPYGYTVSCSAANTVQVVRHWGESNCATVRPGGPHVYSQYFASGPEDCGLASGSGGESQGSFSVTCDDMAGSGTLAQTSGTLPDPVGGGVTLSI